tara:strand:- start:2329 stop:2754 length:426 start_codon:yes stop_codon:yes gene_type:complete
MISFKEQRTFPTTKERCFALQAMGFDCSVTRIEVDHLNVDKVTKATPTVKVTHFNSVPEKPLTLEDIKQELSKYEEDRWWELPKWLRFAISARNLMFGPREPNPFEVNDSKRDYKLHAYFNNLITPQDLYNIYVKGVNYHV